MATRSEKNRILVTGGPPGPSGKDGLPGPIGPVGPPGESGIFGFEIVNGDLIVTYTSPEPPAMMINEDGDLIYQL